MSDKVTKCWYVHSRGEDFGEFVFAATRSKAIYQSEVYWETLDWTATRAVRAPKLDGKEITKDNVEAAGFHWIEH